MMFTKMQLACFPQCCQIGLFSSTKALKYVDASSDFTQTTKNNINIKMKMKQEYNSNWNMRVFTKISLWVGLGLECDRLPDRLGVWQSENEKQGSEQARERERPR